MQKSFWKKFFKARLPWLKSPVCEEAKGGRGDGGSVPAIDKSFYGNRKTLNG
jgi:hypothetical protein